MQRLSLMLSVKRCEIVGRREDPVTGLWSGGRGGTVTEMAGPDPLVLQTLAVCQLRPDP